MNRKKITLLTFTILLFAGCGLFETRTPNPPDDENNVFIPPTSADIVINNFLTAFNNKNVDNYCSCLLDTFKFVPSSDAILKYSGLFDFWKITDERKYFLSLLNILGQSNKMELEFSNIKNEIQSSDSVVLFANYNINLELSDEFDTKYTGILSFTIKPVQNGMWGIVYWADYQNEDGINKTFSELKAMFSN